ncbi:MAG TPA: RluA family pseudouridine synthase [Anseongella sp.]|nr:RluA family pseudouridine synthase [Anseongella sp.]
MKIPSFKSLILFEDNDLIAVNKPAFLSTLDERSGEGPNLLRLAKTYWPEAQICHRLDKETSGVLLIAKNPAAYRHFSMQFEHREMEKVYHAVLEGIHDFRELKVDLPIQNLGKGHVKISRKDGKKAETVFNTLRVFRHYTLAECRPLTGRMHQIRIHLATQRAVICNDEQYGGKPVYLSGLKKNYHLGKQEEEQSLIRRFALHAYSISFLSLDGGKHTITAPYPKDFAALLKVLEKFD